MTVTGNGNGNGNGKEKMKHHIKKLIPGNGTFVRF